MPSQNAARLCHNKNNTQTPINLSRIVVFTRLNKTHSAVRIRNKIQHTIQQGLIKVCPYTSECVISFCKYNIDYEIYETK
jgi:hypothetical protein